MSRMPRRNFAHPITQGCIWRRLSCCVCGYSAWHVLSSSGSTAGKSRETGQWTSALGASAPGHTCSPRPSGFTTCETWESAWVVILSLSSRSLLPLTAPKHEEIQGADARTERKGRMQQCVALTGSGYHTNPDQACLARAEVDLQMLCVPKPSMRGKAHK